MEKLTALIGLSLGGYLAPRAATAEHRLAACVSDCGPYDVSDARKFYDALTCPKRYYQFTAAEGAGQQCESGARVLFHQHAFDWLGQVLDRTATAADGKHDR